MPRFLPQIWQHRPPIFFLACQHAIACLIFVFALLNGSMQAQTSLEVSVAGPSTVRLGGNARYRASVEDKAVSVVWSVDGVAGGTNFTGRISAEGVYSPASTIPAGHSVRIGATTESTPASSGLLRVRVLNPLPTLTSGSVTQAASGMSYLLGTGLRFRSWIAIAGRREQQPHRLPLFHGTTEHHQPYAGNDHDHCRHP
jgi:hypothetical protein